MKSDKIDPFDLCRRFQKWHNNRALISNLIMAKKKSPGKKGPTKKPARIPPSATGALVRRSPRKADTTTTERKDGNPAGTIEHKSDIVSKSKRGHSQEHLTKPATVTQLTPAFEAAAAAEEAEPGDPATSTQTDASFSTPEHKRPNESVENADASKQENTPASTKGDEVSTVHTAAPQRLKDDVYEHVVIHVPLPSDKNLGAWRLVFSKHILATRMFFLDQERNIENSWFTVHRPMIKEYPKIGPDNISFTSGQSDIPLWLTMQDSCGLTRLHFPGLDVITLRCFLHFANVSVPTISAPPGIQKNEHTTIAPLSFVVSLLRNPPQKMVETIGANCFMKTLAESVLPPGKKGATSEIIFRAGLSMPQIQNRVFVVFSSAIQTSEPLAKDIPFKNKNVDKLRNFFKEKDNNEEMYYMSELELGSFHKLCTLGESLSITCLSENGKADVVVSAIQFKRTEHGAWVNYFCTSRKTVDVGPFGSKPGFLPIETPFRGMGLGFLLLRSLQLLLACNKQPPTVFMRVQHSSELFQYLLDRGFVEAPDPTNDEPLPHFTRLTKSHEVTSSNGFLQRDLLQPVVMVLTKLVTWTEKEYWRPPVLDTIKYHHTQTQSSGRNK